MTIEEATLILAELRESMIASSMRMGYAYEMKSTLADRVQAIDIVLDAVGGVQHDES